MLGSVSVGSCTAADSWVDSGFAGISFTGAGAASRAGAAAAAEAEMDEEAADVLFGMVAGVGSSIELAAELSGFAGIAEGGMRASLSSIKADEVMLEDTLCGNPGMGVAACATIGSGIWMCSGSVVAGTIGLLGAS